jgi:hypothetical protein
MRQFSNLRTLLVSYSKHEDVSGTVDGVTEGSVILDAFK